MVLYLLIKIDIEDTDAAGAVDDHTERGTSKHSTTTHEKALLIQM
jgi:hypothetical protein